MGEKLAHGLGAKGCNKWLYIRLVTSHPWDSSALHSVANLPQLPHRNFNKDKYQILHLCWDNPGCRDRLGNKMLRRDESDFSCSAWRRGDIAVHNFLTKGSRVAGTNLHCLDGGRTQGQGMN